MLVFILLLCTGGVLSARPEEACVKTPDGSVICGESVLKQPSTVLNDPEDDEEDGETEADHKSGYTHAQIGTTEWQPSMTYRQLGSTGLRVSSLALGSWITFSFQFGEDKAKEIMGAAFDAGINFFDTAEAYADGDAETIMGKAIQWGIAQGKWRRSDLVIATKVFWGKQDGGKIKSVNDVGLSRKHVIEGVLASLNRLQLDYADIVFAHRFDRTTPIEETVRAFNYLIDTGKIMYWGTSEWPAVDLERAIAIADKLGLIGPCAEQPSYSMIMRDRMELEYSPLFSNSFGRKLGTTIYSPLASGVLTGKYNDGIPKESRFTVKQYAYIKENYLGGSNGSWEELVEKVKALTTIAENLGCTPAQLAIAWCLKNDDVSTILLGASKVEQLIENIGALHVATKLTPDVMGAIDQALGNKPVDKEKDFLRSSMAGNFPDQY